MSCLNGTATGNTGPIILVNVGRPGESSPRNSETSSALIDTRTCISHAVADALGLQPTGKISVQSSTESKAMNTYVVDLFFRFGADPIYSLPAMEVAEFNASPSAFGVLLGRDVLCRGTFVMSADGHFTFCL